MTYKECHNMCINVIDCILYFMINYISIYLLGWKYDFCRFDVYVYLYYNFLHIPDEFCGFQVFI